MKKKYLDIMEKSLEAYSKDRIIDYINDVKTKGLTEHGFARLGSNIGILIAHGRKTEYLPFFIEIMDICCAQMPTRKAANDFTIREVCFCLMLLEEKKTLDTALLNKWKSQIASFDPWNYYTMVVSSPDIPHGNWAMFAATSEYIRGICCGIDTSEFVDRQISTQMLCFDSMDMYKDPNNPMVYDMVTRLLMAIIIKAGYNGKHAKRIIQVLDNTADISLKMLSSTGEIPFGGRSNQFLYNEPLYFSYYELEAARFAQKGDMEKAGQFKASAIAAAENTLSYLSLDPISHIKNRYDLSTKIGCEDYGYFNKYMITVASNTYTAYLFADDSIVPTTTASQNGAYVISTSEDFHKTFLNAGDYFAEIDTCADFHYDANGLGRIHKRNCPSTLCLSVPFSENPKYITESNNKSSMSICCFYEKNGKFLLGSESYSKYALTCSENSQHEAKVEFDVKLSEKITLKQSITLTPNGVDISLSGDKNIGMMIPVFDFDGESDTSVKLGENSLSVEYKGAVCKYSFDGSISEDFDYYYNRNGRYRVYKMLGNNLHIELTEV